MLKKILTLGMATIVTVGTLVAQPKNNEKTVWKNAQKLAKEKTKEGWKVDGSATMEEAFFNHKKKLLVENTQEILGNVQGAMSTKTVNQAKQWSTTNACISYAHQSGMILKGRIVSGINAGTDASSLDAMVSGYEAEVQKNIQGELVRSFGMFREKKDGTIEYVSYYTLNEDAASKARIRAMENMIKESEMARKHAEDISKFVREGFEIQN